METQISWGKISRVAKDPQSNAEKIALTNIFRLALKNLHASVTKGEVIQPKDLQRIYELRQAIGIDELEDYEAYFVLCGACVFSKSCSLYKDGADCSYRLKTDVQSSTDIVEILVQLLRIEGDRIQKALLIEKKDGGVIDRNVSAEMMQYFEMVKTLKEVMQEAESVTVKVSGKGVISKLFGDLIDKANAVGTDERAALEMEKEGDAFIPAKNKVKVLRNGDEGSEEQETEA